MAKHLVKIQFYEWNRKECVQFSKVAAQKRVFSFSSSSSNNQYNCVQPVQHTVSIASIHLWEKKKKRIMWKSDNIRNRKEHSKKSYT